MGKFNSPTANSPSLPLLQRAYRFLQAGDVDEAQRSYREALKLPLKTAAERQLLGYLALELQDYPQARRALQAALRQAPDDPQNHLLLGVTLRREGRLPAAAHQFRQALKLRPGWSDALNNLAITLEDLERYHEAVQILQNGIAATPDDADLHNALGSALCAAGKPEAAIPHYRRAMELEPEFPAFRANLGQALLQKGDWQAGWDLYQARLMVQRRDRFPASNAPFWQGEDLSRGTILIWNEQGFGDTLQFSRYGPLLAERGATVHLRAPAALQRLLETLPADVQILTPDDPLPEVDFQAPLLHLPRFFDEQDWRGEHCRPYLSAAVEPPPPLAETPDTLLRIGLVWAGNPRHPADRRRSLPAKKYLPLLRRDDAAFFSLQVGQSGEALRHSRLIDLEPYLEDFADTAAAVARLDLVISVDTAVAHLAGALGKPVWLLLDYAADWRWMTEREDTPWYPGMRLFRQSRPRHWNGVIKKVAEALQSFNDRSR